MSKFSQDNAAAANDDARAMKYLDVFFENSRAKKHICISIHLKETIII